MSCSNPPSRMISTLAFQNNVDLTMSSKLLRQWVSHLSSKVGDKQGTHGNLQPRIQMGLPTLVLIPQTSGTRQILTMAPAPAMLTYVLQLIVFTNPVFWNTTKHIHNHWPDDCTLTNHVHFAAISEMNSTLTQPWLSKFKQPCPVSHPREAMIDGYFSPGNMGCSPANCYVCCFFYPMVI